MNKLQKSLRSALLKRKSQNILRRIRPLTPEGKMVHIRNKSLMDLSSNDYLGLAQHPALRERAADWAMRYGNGARASRLVSGTLPLHCAVEEKLAALKKSKAALLFATGWQANASLLPAISALSVQETGHRALIFSDKLNHASLHHGCRAAGVQQKRFRHNDLGHLEGLLHKHMRDPGLKFIVTESVFSMDGDCADIPALRYIADKFDAFLYVDEAHATGILGPGGSGLAHGLADITMSTASKALGGMGAFVTGSRALCDYLLNYASGLVYSTAVPPSVLGGLDAALDLLPSLEQERLKVQDHARRLCEILAQSSRSAPYDRTPCYDTGSSDTQIIPIMLKNVKDSTTAILNLAKFMEKEGFLTIPIRPPTVPPNTARLRLALNAMLSTEDIDHLAETLLRYLPKLA